MATTKTVKVIVLKGTHVLEDGAALPVEGETHGTVGRIVRPTILKDGQMPPVVTIPVEVYERSPQSFQLA